MSSAAAPARGVRRQGARASIWAALGWGFSALGAWGAGLIAIALGAGSLTSLDGQVASRALGIALAALGTAALAWGASALTRGQAVTPPLPGAAIGGFVALPLLAVGVLLLDPSIAGIASLAALALLSIVPGLGVARAARHRARERHDERGSTAAPRGSQGPAVAAIIVAAIVVAGIATPALGATAAGRAASGHGGHGGHGEMSVPMPGERAPGEGEHGGHH